MQINKDGNWRLYTNTIPAGSTALGTVTRDEGDTGALVRIEATGAYVQVNAGAIRSLDGRKVAAALGLTGRPPVAPEDRKDARVELRVHPDTKTAWQAKAEAAGLSMAAWIEATLTAAKK
jgi:hypothetical protein